ncbi:FtsX-like permease family protein [Spirochaetota bacterium]
MPVTLRMALRNLFQHKAKSLIVGILLALGMLIIVLGTAFLDASKRGIESSFTRNYTGDVIITGVGNGPVSLFGVQSVGSMEQTPIVPDYEKIMAHVKGLPETSMAAGSASGYGMIINDSDDEESLEDMDEDSRMSTILMLFGVDAPDYWKLFDNIKLASGDYLKPGQKGIMLASDRLDKIGKALKRNLKIGDEVLIQGFGSTGMRLRSVPIVGSFIRASESAGPEQLSYIDIDTLRILSGMTVGAAEAIELSDKETFMLELSDLDSLFGSDFDAFESADTTAKAISEADFDSLLGDTSRREELNLSDSGAWHSILVRLDRPEKTAATILALNQWFAKEGIDANAGDWQKAAGPYSKSVDLLRIIFTIAIIILAVVSIIIIMNTLVVSIIERTSEIGTMRALGGNKFFIRKLFVAETISLAFIFGIIGIILSFIASGVINAMGIEASNEFLQILFGGKMLRTSIDPLSLLWSLLLIILVGVVSSFYPVSVALRIQPVQAMQA